MVLALALVHHLVFKHGLTLDHIAALFDAFAEKSLLVEFVPKEDKYVRNWWTADFAWYSADSFEKSLGRYFKSIERVPSHPDPRIIFVCYK
jgi:hypothetical protein